jgi:hypothetical protein
VRRVNVKGTSGSGKTTFLQGVARRLDLPHVELDALHHGPNWSEPTDEIFRARVRGAMDAAPDGWVIDGNYEGKLGDLVIGEADTIVCSGAATRRPGAVSSGGGTRSSGGCSRPISATGASGRNATPATRASCG